MLVWLVAAVAALWLAEARRLPVLPATVVAIACAAVSGLTFPDLDQWLPGLDHRDALTHSILPALALLRRWLRPAACGLALGLALHLAADCFPEAMRGFATVKLPFAGSIGGWSYPWLAVNAVLGAALFGWLLEPLVPGRIARRALLAAAVPLGLWYLLRVDGGWWALATLGALGWAGWRLHRRWAAAP